MRDNYKKNDNINTCNIKYEKALYFNNEGRKTSMLRYDETIFLKLSKRDFIKVQTISLAIAANFTDLLVNNLASEPNSATGKYIYWTLRSNFA